MARNLEFYKGARKKRNYALIPFLILLGLAVLVVVSFYAMQKYAAISKEGVEVILPGMQREETVTDSQGHEIREFETVDANIVFQQPDYSRVAATAGRYARPIRAIYIASEDLNHDNLMEKAGRLSDGNALMIEMKPRTGVLNWASRSTLATRYGLYYDTEVTQSIEGWIQELKALAEEQDKEIWLAAQMSCCVDAMLATHSTSYALRTEYGADYMDETGTWLDPYNPEIRSYLVQLVQELYDMGFDEVVLADVMHPVPEQKEGQETPRFLYSAEMSTEPTPINAVCGLAMYVANQFADRGRGQLLSIYVNSPRSLVGADQSNGQDSTLFFKVYDRVYYNTDMYAFTYNLQDIDYAGAITVGDSASRFVPVVINYLPKHDSWIYKEDLPPATED